MACFLVKRSINALFNQGYDRLTLLVTEKNIPALRLYEGLGFRPTHP
jgi:ribosomal protein S18 acetylase RimI-like enzyme